MSRYGDNTVGWTTEESEFDCQKGSEMFHFFRSVQIVPGADPASYLLSIGGLSL
jgi:hypothetical protein